MVPRSATDPVEMPEYISELEVARSYLQAEMAKHLELIGSPLRGDETREKLLEQLRFYSTQVRNNKVYEAVTNEDYSWVLIDVPVEDILMGQINKRTNVVLERVGYNLVAFTQYLRAYFE